MATRPKDGSQQVARLPSGDWHPEAIKAAVRMARPRMTLQRLARETGLHPHACVRAIHQPHYLGELAIAELLGERPAVIWPSRHDAAGARTCQVRTATKVNGGDLAGHPESPAPARERAGAAPASAPERRAAA